MTHVDDADIPGRWPVVLAIFVNCRLPFLHFLWPRMPKRVRAVCSFDARVGRRQEIFIGGKVSHGKRKA